MIERKTHLTDEKKEKTKSCDNATIVGPVWFMGWLFTIAFAKLTFWKAVLALIIWPYYLGAALAG